MLFRLTTIAVLLFLCVQRSLQFNPEDDYYEPPKYNDIVLQPAPTLLGEDETGCICREIPKSFTLCFGRTKCEIFPINITISTPMLSIISTHVSTIRAGSFNHLNFLKDLKIEGNYNLTYIAPGVFQENTKLENLSISFNPNLKAIYEDTFIGLKNLKQLFLIKNGFTNLYEVAKTLRPITLPNLSKLSLNENKFKNIYQNDLSPMENSSLEELDLILCRLEYMHPTSLNPLKNLQALRLGENIFNVSTITNVLNETVKNSIPIKLLNLYSAGFRANLPKELLEIVSKSSISHLNLAKNQFVVIPSDAFPLMPNLLALDLKEDLISDIADDAFKNLPNLQTLILSDNFFLSLPRGVLLRNLVKLDIQQNSITSSKSSYFDISVGIFSDMENLEHLNLNSNNIAHLYSDSFVGLNNLRYLSLKNCTIYHIQNRTFSHMKNLTYLNLDNNYFIINNYPAGLYEGIFHGLDNLEVLLLGGNNIVYFSKYGNPFNNLKSLKTLGLDRNFISTIAPLEFRFLKNLEYLDLSYNLMKVWHERIFAFNHKLKMLLIDHNKLTYFTPAMLQDFSNFTTISLSYNSLNCDCDSYKYFTEYTVNHNESKITNLLKSADTRCLNPYISGNRVILNLFEYFDSIEAGSIYCDIDQRLVVLLPLVILILAFLSLGTLAFYYRWHIKYWMFLARLHLSRNGKIKQKQQEKPKCSYEYDAFVSYSCEDRNFVVRLVAMLEHHEPFLRLCVYERDFHVGKFISDCVLRCIAKSRKTILVVSDNYAKSQWCRWESSIAEHHRLFFENNEGEYVDDALVVIKLGPVNKNHMTPMLRYLLKTRIYLQWDADEKKQKQFWRKLRETLAPPKCEKIAEITHM